MSRNGFVLKPELVENAVSMSFAAVELGKEIFDSLAGKKSWSSVPENVRSCSKTSSKLGYSRPRG